MIPFSEKLSFLMYICKAENKELAAALSVDASLISLMRTGKRKLPKDTAKTEKMAEFFARRCSAAYQRQALSEMLGKAAIGTGMPIDVLAAYIAEWISGGKNLADEVLSDIKTVSEKQGGAGDLSGDRYDGKSYGTDNVHSGFSAVREPFGAKTAPLTPTDGSDGKTLFFYGNAGRREVMSHVMRVLKEVETPGAVYTLIDDNLEWLLSDYMLTQTVQRDFMEVLARGFTFHQVMPPLNYINRYAESLKFWLPVYATGQTKVYYYPRLRGNLYRHSIIVVPGKCVQYAASAAVGSTSDITMFSTDTRLVAAFEKQFNEIVAMCRPALNVYHSLAEAAPCFPKFFACRGESVQAVNSLSVNSMPVQLLERFVGETTDAQWAKTFRTIADASGELEARFSGEPYIDMCRLATAEEIKSGRAKVAVPVATESGGLCYTAETYVMHLKNILRLMEEYENYFFLPLPDDHDSAYNLFANESGIALIVSTRKPLTVLEISRPAMVTAFREHLLRIAESVGYDGIEKEKVKMKLRALIQELGSGS